MKIISAFLCTVVLSVAMVTVQGTPIVSMEKRNLTRTVLMEICAGYTVGQLRDLYTGFHMEYGLEVPLEGIFQSLTLKTPVMGDSVEFSSNSTCPDATPADTMWCLRLASAVVNTTTCWQPGGEVLTSEESKSLELAANVEVEPESGSLVIENATKLYTNALVSAITRTDGCTSVAHTVIFLQKRRNIAPTLIEFPPDTKAVAGKKLSLKCTYSTSSGYHYLHWYKDEQDIPLILEDPNCERLNKSCKTDIRYSKDHAKRKSNIRSYMYSQRFCLHDSVYRHAVLVIDKAGPDDAGSYTCKLFNLSSTEPLHSATLTVQVE